MTLLDIFNECINNAQKKALANREASEGYYKNGVLYCSKCNTPKESNIKIFDIIKKVPCACLCEYEKYVSEKKSHEMKEKIQELKRNGIADPIFCKWTFDIDDGKTPAIRYAHKYANNWEEMLKQNIGLLLSGPPGVGKTFITSCIGNAIILKLYPVLMTSFPRLLNELINIKEEKNLFYNRLNKFSLLIIDDFGIERQSDFVTESIFQIIDNRYKMNLPLIISTNIPINEIKTIPDIKQRRIYDRILEMCIPIEVKGPNRRQNIASKKMDNIRNFFLS